MALGNPAETGQVAMHETLLEPSNTTVFRRLPDICTASAIADMHGIRHDLRFCD
jgi:hypothetical protein